jgi:ArsR family transcriptional regulator
VVLPQSNSVGISSNGWGKKMNPTTLENPAEQTSTAKAARLTRARRTAILKALADPRRFELLERIAKAGCPLGCAQALAALPISAATLSHHIKELETAGLINVRREGKFHFLTLRPGVLQAVATVLAALESAPCGPR